jgi:hypothetical protein
MTWAFVAAGVAAHITQQTRQDIRVSLPVDVRFVVSRNRREGGYCGKELGSHARAGNPYLWGSKPSPTLRDWRRWQA